MTTALSSGAAVREIEPADPSRSIEDEIIRQPYSNEAAGVSVLPCPEQRNQWTRTLPPPGEHPKSARPTAVGKFIFVGSEKFWVKGVTYGAFRPDGEKREYQDREQLARDFMQMAAAGINTVRIPHTMPPRHLLDIAHEHGLRVMVGLAAEQYAGYLIDKKKKAPDILGIVREKVRTVAGHPALLCYAVGNEITAPVVRWIGRRRVEKYIGRVFQAIKDVDPEGLVTYVNYPTTEYLQLPFLDLLAFNVYLESPDRLEAYLARLQNIAGDRPLLMSEVGLDALRNGEDAQSDSLEWQIRTAFAAACAGVVVFSWTDEWFRADAEVEDWAFGLTTKDRRPKKALAAVSRAFHDVPFAMRHAESFPLVSVIVCSYNGARTVRDTLDALERIEYPNYEVIVVDDGSTDSTAAIAREYPVRLVQTENRGLSNARNTGWQEATGEIVAYIDDDAYPDPHWLQYLAHTLVTTNCVGVGGPNIAPAGDGFIAECVANSPGGPVHVLISDREAEHIPGCNMAFRRSALEAIGGFDPRYQTAGDDVDLCWRLHDRGWKLGFHAGAMDWHHRRNSVRAYWRQQIGYGKAEALLEAKWPERYNALGHTTWAGRLYGRGRTLPLWLKQHVYAGVMGAAPFQSLYERDSGTLVSLPLMPEWYLLIAALSTLSLLGVLWTPLLWTLVPLTVAVVALLAQAAVSATRAGFPGSPVVALHRRASRWILTASLHLLQPLGRLRGRMQHGLTLWRNPGTMPLSFPWAYSSAVWTAKWAPPETRPRLLEDALRAARVRYVHGGGYDDWDLAVLGGPFGRARMLMAIEDHGAGAQYIRTRVRPWVSPAAFIVCAGLATLGASALVDGSWPVGLLLVGASLAVLARTLYECACSVGAIRNAVAALERAVA